jgi:hypothetical protein
MVFTIKHRGFRKKNVPLNQSNEQYVPETKIHTGCILSHGTPMISSPELISGKELPISPKGTHTGNTGKSIYIYIIVYIYVCIYIYTHIHLHNMCQY